MCIICRTSSPGGRATDRRIIRAARSQRDRVSGGGGEEEQLGAEADGADIPGSVAGISHLRAGTTVAQSDQSSASGDLARSRARSSNRKTSQKSVEEI